MTFFCFRRLAVDHENVRADIVILGKALSGGILPVFIFVLSLIHICGCNLTPYNCQCTVCYFTMG